LEAFNYGDGAGQAVNLDDASNANVLLGIAEEDPKVAIKEWLVKVGAL
jgi:hypothetical protein